jgi:hypothetical protein
VTLTNQSELMMQKMRSPLSFFVVALVLCITGCSGSTDQPEVADVSGVVTLDGKPVAGVNI